MNWRLFTRVGWGVADQGFSSLTNFAVGVVVARTLGPSDFGAFSLAFATYLVALNVARAVATEPLVIRYSGTDTETWRSGVGRAMGTSVAVGVAGGVVCLGTGLLLAGPLRVALIALGLTLPGLLLQDGWRFAFFSGTRGSRALVNDVVWAVALIPGLGLPLLLESRSVVHFLLGWAGAANVAALAGIVQARVLPKLSHVFVWLREQRDLAPRYLGEFAASGGAPHLYSYAIGAIAGLAAVGGIRAAELLLGPIQVLHMGIGIMAIPEAVVLARRSIPRMRALCMLISAGLGLVALIWGAVMVMLPSEMGTRLLGPSWGAASVLLLPLALRAVTSSVSSGALVGLRGLAAAKRSLHTRLLDAGVVVTFVLTGAVVSGAVGAAWGLALAGVVGVILWWTQLFRAVNEARAPSEPSSESSVLAEVAAARMSLDTSP